MTLRQIKQSLDLPPAGSRSTTERPERSTTEITIVHREQPIEEMADKWVAIHQLLFCR